MSRGRGFGRGRGSFGAGNLPPMGLTHADVQAISREATAMYPPMRPPVMSEFTEDEKKMCQYQIGYATRLKQSAYYVVEATKSKELPRYSDKYRPSSMTQPKLKRKDLHEEFFPKDIFEDYFNPRRKKVPRIKKQGKFTVNLSDLEGSEKSADEASELASQGDGSDYDVDEEYDNDYADNYFDNGEGDDMDDLGGGGGGDGGGDYD
ncbi:DNA-directed RNA polymerase III, subunit Rpc31 [Desarmillaria tabescens]|uniref:DNA-directed RNA polymerase III subunit n=1 Tax=Armillaria tabescens TaxID=1929756 RepID=A0AA39KHD7_ARMTA|nr:DNA-directed RNA polymerase III, subunit Rpc31 [Desarmillaria tabescens]KAK0458893.1 DNA-directed RNA polymerase III, subunit Rpc31 [Desarmillaria tabescens]